MKYSGFSTSGYQSSGLLTGWKFARYACLEEIQEAQRVTLSFLCLVYFICQLCRTFGLVARNALAKDTDEFSWAFPFSYWVTLKFLFQKDCLNIHYMVSGELQIPLPLIGFIWCRNLFYWTIFNIVKSPLFCRSYQKCVKCYTSRACFWIGKNLAHSKRFLLENIPICAC